MLHSSYMRLSNAFITQRSCTTIWSRRVVVVWANSTPDQIATSPNFTFRARASLLLHGSQAATKYSDEQNAGAPTCDGSGSVPCSRTERHAHRLPAVSAEERDGLDG